MAEVSTLAPELPKLPARSVGCAGQLDWRQVSSVSPIQERGGEMGLDGLATRCKVEVEVVRKGEGEEKR